LLLRMRQLARSRGVTIETLTNLLLEQRLEEIEVR